MSEEVSAQTMIAVVIVMIASFLSVILNVAIQSYDIMSLVENKTGDATSSVSSAQILQLQDNYQNYLALYKVYINQGGLINSISGKDKDGVGHVHYCVDSAYCGELSNIQSILGGTRLRIYDAMESDYLRDYCKESTLSYVLRITVTPSKIGKTYDIYYEVMDRDY